MRESKEMEVVHKEKGGWELDGSPLLWMHGCPLLWTGNPQQRVGEGVVDREGNFNDKNKCGYTCP